MPFDNVPLASPLVLMLQAARSKIEQGWCQGAMRQRGKVCMFGALSHEDDGSLSRAAAEVLLAAIHSRGYSHGQVTAFNDAAGRTKEQVLEVYDAAIARARSNS
jgi:hypothetical protein